MSRINRRQVLMRSAAEGIRPILGYLAALIVGLLVVALVPSISIGIR